MQNKNNTKKLLTGGAKKIVLIKYDCFWARNKLNTFKRQSYFLLNKTLYPKVPVKIWALNSGQLNQNEANYVDQGPAK